MRLVILIFYLTVNGNNAIVNHRLYFGLQRQGLNVFNEIKKRVLQGNELSFQEAMYLADLQGRQLHQLVALAGEITARHGGNNIDLCSIINAKSGNCSEDCKFCAQSARYHTGIKNYRLLDLEIIVAAAQEAEARGINRFSLVTSGRELSEEDFNRVLTIYQNLYKKTKLKLCTSLGLLDTARAFRLKEAGVSMVHHNLETCRSFFPQICTSHTYEQRVNTIKAAQQAGLKVCSGGIISIGETMAQRLELAYELKELRVDSVPVNILHPIPGTPLENQQIIPPEEIIKTICLFRLILPGVLLRFAGGRKEALGELRGLGFLAGINGAIMGDFLTTPGDEFDKDIQLIKSLGLSVTPLN